MQDVFFLRGRGGGGRGETRCIMAHVKMVNIYRREKRNYIVQT